jgi:hypothetical protein
MHKLTKRGEFVATVMLIVFGGIMLTAMAFGTKAGYDSTRRHSNTQHTQTVMEIKDVSSIDVVPVPEITLAEIINPVPETTLAEVITPAPSNHRTKEIIVCQVIDGVKHFSNEFVQEVA